MQGYLSCGNRPIGLSRQRSMRVKNRVTDSLELNHVIVSSSWGVLVAQHQRHALVSKALTELGNDHFIPIIETLSIDHGRHIRGRRPLLGDYIPFAVSSIWKSLMRIRGVRGILLNDLGFPAQVMPKEMEQLRSICADAHNFVTRGFEYGQRVSPRDGPFNYHIGRYDHKNKRGEDVALFQLFGQEQRVMFKAGDLLAV